MFELLSFGLLMFVLMSGFVSFDSILSFVMKSVLSLDSYMNGMDLNHFPKKKKKKKKKKYNLLNPRPLRSRTAQWRIGQDTFT